MNRPFAALAQSLTEGRKELAAAFLNGTLTPFRYLHAHARLVDATLAGLTHVVPLPRGAALLAVGGYGRRALFPMSDVDLMLLVPHELDEKEQAQAEQFVAALWDVGLEVGMSVRTVDQALELAAEEITVQTNLLEGRRVVGSATLATRLARALRAQLEPLAFYRAKAAEQERRHSRWLSPYALEPNLKEHPGGQRDLDLLLWIAQALGYRGRWAALAKAGLLLAEEARELDRCQRFLARVRIELHLLSRRREDRLLFDYQSALAERLGIKHTGEQRPAERFMRRYFLNAKIVLQLNTVLMASFAERLAPPADEAIEPLDRFFVRRGNRLDLKDDNLFADHPEAFLALFLRMAQHPELSGLTARAARRLWAERDRITPEYHLVPEHQRLFLELLKQPRGIVHETRRMNQFGILSRYLPPWRKIVCQMQYDLYHEYTVDLHTLMVIRNLRRFTMEEHAHEYPEMTALMGEFGEPWLLYLAAIFHDIGKGRGGDHSVIGAELARTFLSTHPIAPEAVELVSWLVAEHLTMSRIAQKEDISDPATIERFAAIVGNERRLIALYLLTHADIRGTSAKVWTPWKARLLSDLFHATRSWLRREGSGLGAPTTRPDPLAERQEQARAILRFHGIRPGEEASLWQRLGPDYFLRHHPETIAWHTRLLYWRHCQREPVVRARLLPDGSGVQVMVFAPDAPQLLVRLLDVFYCLNADIWEARIYTTPDHWALDTFVLDFPPDHAPRESLALLEYELLAALDRNQPLTPIRCAPRRLPRLVRHFGFPPQITLAPDESGNRFVLTVVALDRPGTLLALVTALAHWDVSIHLARIHTAGERIEDAFVVSGPGLERPERQNAIVQALTRVLERLGEAQ
ncbi:[protein-PII] uridylyltransferase [Hydrogenophilus islandicus]